MDRVSMPDHEDASRRGLIAEGSNHQMLAKTRKINAIYRVDAGSSCCRLNQQIHHRSTALLIARRRLCLY